MNADQEAEYRAKGYTAPSFDAAAVERMTTAPLPQGYRHQEYPRMLGKLIDQGPDYQPPSDFEEYPKWVAGEVVNSQAEEAAVLARGSSKNEPVQPGDAVEPKPEPEEVDPDELAEFRAWKAAQQDENRRYEQAAAASRNAIESNWPAERQRQLALISQLQELGFKVDTRFSLRRLEAMLVNAQKEKGRAQANPVGEKDSGRGRGDEAESRIRDESGGPTENLRHSEQDWPDAGQ